MNAFDDMYAALSEAKDVMQAADIMADKMADLMRGRLRKVPAYKLKRLKRELSQFNARTGKWREEA